MRKSDIVMEGILQDEQVSYTLVELSEICVVDSTVLIQMIEVGILEPQQKKPVLQFDSHALKRVQKALRLHHDLAVNWEGLSLVLDLLEEIQELEQQLELHNR